MNLRHLEHFLQVLEHGSVSRAAESNGLTQSGLTKSIRALEDRIGARLLARLPRGVAPTVLGEALRVRATLVLAQMRDMEAEMRALQQGATGVLTIGAGPSWLRRCLPTAVAQLHAAMPKARLKLRTGFDAELIQCLEQGELDFVVAASHEAQGRDRIATYPLTVDRQSVIVARSHPLNRDGTVSIGELDGYGWVLPDRATAQRQRFEGLFWATGRHPPEAVIETTSVSFMLALIGETSLLSFATASILGSGERHGDRVTGNSGIVLDKGGGRDGPQGRAALPHRLNPADASARDVR